jgi:hypothetical protein
MSATRLGVRRTAKYIVCAVIIAVAAVTCGWKAHDDLTTTKSLLTRQSIAASNLDDRAWECIYRSIRADVPRGASVYIGASDGELYFQRLSELSTSWATPVSSRSAARLSLDISRVPHFRDCSGMKLRVTRT